MRERDLTRVLLSALTSTDAEQGTDLHHGLLTILRPAFDGHPELAASWEDVRMRSDNENMRRFSTELLRCAADNNHLHSALRRWLATASQSGSNDTRKQSNTISGSAHIWGSAIQAGEVHGGIHLHQTEPSHSPVPRQLPPVSPHFGNRERELTELDDRRASHPPSTPQVIVVSGPPGVGKTAFASHWLTGHAMEFPEGQLYADLGGYSPTGPLDPGEVLERFLRTLGVTDVPSQVADRAALWRTFTAESRLAILLDNAFTAAQVRPLLPGGPGSVVVVASRRQLTGLVVDGGSLHRLEGLSPSAAVDLLNRGGGGSRVTSEPEAAREVVALCAYLPLAVCLAAAQLAGRPRQPVSAMARALARGHGPLETLRVEGEAAIRTALDASYRLLSPEVARTYRRMGLLPVDRFSTELISAVCASSSGDVNPTLDILIETNLLEELGPESYRFHGLVHAHAEQRAEAEETSEERSTVLRRFVDWCLLTATAAEAVLSPSHRTLARDYVHPPAQPARFQDAAEALAWLDVHRTSLMAAVRHCATHEWHAACWQLVDACWPLFLRLRPAQLWLESHRLGLAAARRAGDRKGEARMLTSGAGGFRNAGQPDEAASWYHQALLLAEEDADTRQQAQALNGLGKANLQAGHLDEAEHYLSQALTLRQSIGYTRGVALSRLDLGQVRLARADYARATEFLLQARADLLAVSDAYDAARALALLGQAVAAAGDQESGSHQLRQALTEFRATGSRHWQARTLETLGEIAERDGAQDQARQWYERALHSYLSFSPGDVERLEGRLREL